MSLSPFIMVFCFGPAAAMLLVSLVMEQARNAPNGTNPQGNLVLRSLVGGIIAVVVSVLLIGLLIVTTRSSNSGLWFGITPWIFAIGQALGLFWPNNPQRPPS